MNYKATGASFKYNYVNEIAEEINCEKSCSFRDIVKTECGPSRDMEGHVLVAECMNDTGKIVSFFSEYTQKGLSQFLVFVRV